MRNARTMALLVAAVMIQLLGEPKLRVRAETVDPAAVLVQMTGAVQVQHSGKAPSAATIGMHLLPGDKLIVPEGGKAVLLYRTGKMQTAKGPGPIVISDTKASQSAGLFSRTVQTLSVVATTDARAHPNRQGMIRPIAGSAVPISPRNQVKVLSVRPTLVWFRIADAPAYIVQVRRVDAACTSAPAEGRPALCKPVRYQAGADTSFTVPEKESLVRGAAYEWAVAPTSGGRVSETQRFQIAGDKELSAINAQLKEITTAGLDPAADGLFLSALAYRNAGLFYDAKHSLDRIPAAAAKGKAFHQLKGEVLDALGDLNGAAREFSEADAQTGS